MRKIESKGCNSPAEDTVRQDQSRGRRELLGAPGGGRASTAHRPRGNTVGRCAGNER